MSARAADARKGLIGPAITAAVCFAILVSLGVWQLQRLAWKEALIARINTRIHQSPEPLPPRAQWAGLQADDYDYRHVRAKGHYLPGELLIFRGSSPIEADRNIGPGYQVMTPFAVEGGGTLIVNRGFAPLAWKDQPALRTAPPSGEVEISGLMREPEDRNAFTPADEPAKNLFYTRDPAAMAAALKLQNPAPFALDLDADPASKGWPHGGATELNIPNNHLSYAWTWFGLAATLVGVFGVWAWGRAKGRGSQPEV
ncbi:MAG TPA: SURF1 family protein [Beijerinckiaceae bacterium]|nr:SURF1 family protein [Beijerinckiaceae bacterium]